MRLFAIILSFISFTNSASAIRHEDMLRAINKPNEATPKRVHSIKPKRATPKPQRVATPPKKLLSLENPRNCTKGMDVRSYLKIKVNRDDRETPDDIPNDIEDYYITVPTSGDGDCFFHAVFTAPGETHQTVSRKASNLRRELVQKINEGQYIDDCRQLLFEDYKVRLFEGGVIPRHIRRFFDSQDTIDTIHSLLRQIEKSSTENEDLKQLIDPLIAVYREPEYTQMPFMNTVLSLIDGIQSHDDIDAVCKNIREQSDQISPTIRAALSERDVKNYMQRFRINRGADSYISYRPDMKCPAAILAEIGAKRVHIFEYNHKKGVLDFMKTVGKQTGKACCVLRHGIHYWALYNDAMSRTQKNSLKQVAKNAG